MTDPGPAVHKFGGTSLATGDMMSRAARLVDEAGGVPVVVVSALAGVTSELERLAADPEATLRHEALEVLARRHREVARTALEGSARTGLSGNDASGDRALAGEIDAVLEKLASTLSPSAAHSGSGEADPFEAGPYGNGRRDGVVACGEDLSAAIMAAVLRAGGRDAQVVDARTVVRTDARFGRAVPEDETTVRLAWERLGPVLARGTIPVLQGFVGADARGRTTTLGRGGSDFTAAIVGAALGSPEVTIWTDVDGIFSADPRQVPGARILGELGYEEAVELAYFGAKVIHPAAAKHAVGRHVALRVRNTFHPDRPGTLIRTDQRGAPGVAALAHKPGTALIRVRSRPLFMAYGFLSRVFDALARHQVPVDLVATSHTSTAFTVDRSAELESVRRSLEEFAEVEVVDRLATVSAIGRGLLEAPGVAGQIFTVLGDAPIQLISQATDTSLSFLVAEAEAPGIVARLHEALIENGETAQ